MKRLDLMFKDNQIAQGTEVGIKAMSLEIGLIVFITVLTAMAQIIIVHAISFGTN